MVKISRRAEEMGTETAFEVVKEIERLEGEYREKGLERKIIKFHIGQPDFLAPKEVSQATIAAIKEGRHGYTPSAGILSLREAVADYFSRTRKMSVNPDSVVIECGAKPFIHHTVQTVTDYGLGDEVIFPSPGFPIYHSQIKALGARPRAWELRENQDGYYFDLNDLEQLVNEKTRLLILNSPHNPTGVTFDEEFLKAVAGIVSRYDQIWAYSDEPYSSLVFDQDFRSFAALPGMKERTLIVDCISKRYAAPGFRLGFASNEKLARSLANCVTNINSCAPHPVQYGAIAALKGSQTEAEAMKQEFRKRRDFIVEGLNQIEGVNCPLPGGSFYAWAKVDGVCEMLNLRDSEELQKRLLYEAGLAVLADKHFIPQGAEYQGQHLRFAFTVCCEKIGEGMQKLQDYIRKHKR